MTDQMCVCKKPLINLTGVCQVCGLERLHIHAKVPPTPFASTRLPDPDEREAA